MATSAPEERWFWDLAPARQFGQPWCLGSTYFRHDDHFGKSARVGKSVREVGGVLKGTAAMIVTATSEPMSALSSDHFERGACSTVRQTLVYIDNCYTLRALNISIVQNIGL